jgi:hypothetical protein
MHDPPPHSGGVWDLGQVVPGAPRLSLGSASHALPKSGHGKGTKLPRFDMPSSAAPTTCRRWLNRELSGTSCLVGAALLVLSALALVALVSHQRMEHAARSSWAAAVGASNAGANGTVISHTQLGVSRQSVVRAAVRFHETWADPAAPKALNITPPYHWTVRNLLGTQ